MRKALLAILPIVLAGAGASACASAQAKSVDKPALSVPPPPPHEIAIPAEPLEPVGEIPGSSATPSGSAAPRPGRTSREVPPKPQGSEVKPETRPDAPASPAPAPPTAPETAPSLPPPPTPVLKTPQTADTSAAAKTVRTTIERAKNTLNGVKFAPLSSEGKKAYKDAQLFLQQAEDALKDGNIVLAQADATKADRLARELAGR